MDKAKFGLTRDLAQMKEGASITATELRAFMQDMKGKNPHEVLGMVAQSSLVQATILATIWTVALLAVGTIVPYYWSQIWPATKPAVAAAPATTAATPVANTAASTPAAPQAPGTGAASQTEPGLSFEAGTGAPGADSQRATKGDDVLDKLGVGEQKMADPNENPLDKGDDILKGID